MLPDNNNGMAVNPMFAQSAKFGNSSPPAMSYEDGGAIPEEDYGEDSEGALDAPEPDETTRAVGDALRTVNSVLMYGRQKHGLPSDEGDEEMAFEDGGAIPDEDILPVIFSDDPLDRRRGQMEQVLAKDIEQSNNATGDGPQWGRPERLPVAENGESAPISTNNLDMSQYPEQTAIPQQEAGNTGGAPYQEDMSAMTAPTDDASLNRPQDMAPVEAPEQSKKQQTILSYLMGADAVDAETGDRVMKMNGNDAAKAIDYMVKNGGGEHQGYGPGWAMAQYLRRKYDLYMNHGRAAVDNDDYENAANSVMKAFENVPDGQKVEARPTQDGLAVTVSEGGKPVASAQLNKEQLDQLTNTGKSGQFDAVLQGGVPSVLQNLQRGTGYIGANGLARMQGGEAGFYGRDPQTGKNFTEGNRPATPAENQYEVMHRARDRLGFMGVNSNPLSADMRAAIHRGDVNAYNRLVSKGGAWYGDGDAPPIRGDAGTTKFPGYQAYQKKYYGYDPVNETGPKPLADKPSGRPVTVMQGADGNKDRQYIDGVDQTPSEQDKKLELIRARGEGREKSSVNQLEREKLKQDRTDVRAEKTGERQAARDKAISERREKSGSLSNERAQRSLEYRLAGERLRLKKDGYKDEDIEKMISATYGKVGQSSSQQQGATPQAPQPQAPAPPRLKLPDGRFYIRGPDGKAMLDPNQ
jgi:hypothetical protein